MAELVDARASEARAPEAWEFESPPGDQLIGDVSIPGEAGAQLAFIRPTCPARYRGLGLRVGRCSAEFHTLGATPEGFPPGSTPRPATVRCSSMARYANWHRGQVENLVPVGSNPTRATAATRPVV